MAVTGGNLALPQWQHHCKGGAWYHTSMVVRMTLLTTERLFWHCGAHINKGVSTRPAGWLAGQPTLSGWPAGWLAGRLAG